MGPNPKDMQGGKTFIRFTSLFLQSTAVRVDPIHSRPAGGIPKINTTTPRASSPYLPLLYFRLIVHLGVPVCDAMLHHHHPQYSRPVCAALFLSLGEYNSPSDKFLNV